MTNRKRHTARDIPRLSKGIHCFDPTLYLRVQATGARSWIQRITVHGRQVDRGLGGWPLVPLDDARLTALENRRAARTGHDPFTDRRRARLIPTVAAVATATLDANRDRWAAASVKAWGATLRRYVIPRLGSMRITMLTRESVIDCLTAIPSVAEARKARMRIRQLCELAIARGWISDNPANGGIDAALPHLRTQASTHHAAMPHAAVGAFLRGLLPAGTAAASALAFLILTASRSDEARGATWAEVDTNAATWTISGARMKNGRAHRVPLSPAALAILADRRGLHPRLVFASDRAIGKPVSGEGIRKLVPDVTPHGFRTSFQVWAADVAQAPREVSGAALSHVNGNRVEQAYTRTDYLERRRGLMADWAAYLTR